METVQHFLFAKMINLNRMIRFRISNSAIGLLIGWPTTGEDDELPNHGGVGWIESWSRCFVIQVRVIHWKGAGFHLVQSIQTWWLTSCRSWIRFTNSTQDVQNSFLEQQPDVWGKADRQCKLHRQTDINQWNGKSSFKLYSIQPFHSVSLNCDDWLNVALHSMSHHPVIRQQQQHHSGLGFAGTHGTRIH